MEDNGSVKAGYEGFAELKVVMDTGKPCAPQAGRPAEREEDDSLPCRTGITGTRGLGKSVSGIQGLHEELQQLQRCESEASKVPLKISTLLERHQANQSAE